VLSGSLVLYSVDALLGHPLSVYQNTVRWKHIAYSTINEGLKMTDMTKVQSLIYDGEKCYSSYRTVAPCEGACP